MHVYRSLPILGLIAAGLAGCSGNPLSLQNVSDASSTETKIATSSLAVPGIVMASLGGSTTERVEPPVEIYSRIARGALRCWFGMQGSLKKTHVFHADVSSQTTGGGAEIAIYERDKTGQAPRSIRAFRISIAASGNGSHVQPENFRMPENVARDMAADVGRWTQGQDDCSVVGLGGWTAEKAKDEAPAEPAATKAKAPAKR